MTVSEGRHNVLKPLDRFQLCKLLRYVGFEWIGARPLSFQAKLHGASKKLSLATCWGQIMDALSWASPKVMKQRHLLAKKTTLYSPHHSFCGTTCRVQTYNQELICWRFRLSFTTSRRHNRGLYCSRLKHNIRCVSNIPMNYINYIYIKRVIVSRTFWVQLELTHKPSNLSGTSYRRTASATCVRSFGDKVPKHANYWKYHILVFIHFSSAAG